MFSDELREGETLASILDRKIAEVIEEDRQRKAKEQRDYEEALTAAKPLLDVLAVLGRWFSGLNDTTGLSELQIQVKLNGHNFGLMLCWNPAIEKWLIRFPKTTYISAEVLETYHLRFLASVNWAMLARTIAEMATECGVAPPRFAPQDALPQDAASEQGE
ncbi:hypothetical protein IPM09_03140 [Candidatus Saccharibacteria bacterium]|nr:MAG: hypothetical protein IPM09_03140 [Candidatus Saccharibacteria bacterium]